MSLTSLNAASLLDTDLADLADLPSFKVPSAGYYKLSVECEVKPVNGKEAVVANYTVLDTLELADPTATPPINGDGFGEMFSLDNEYGVGKLKKFLQPFAEAFGTTNIGALLEQIKGVQIGATVKQRKDKNDESKVYAVVEGTTLM